MQQINEDGHIKGELRTLSSCIEKMQKDGFTENFMVNELGLYDVSSEKIYKPGEVKILNFFRFEGETDPADSSILYAIETSNGLRGLLTDSYGPYADADVNNFISEVEEISKKTKRHEKL